MARPGPPDLPGEGPAPGRWVKNRTARHLAPGGLLDPEGVGEGVAHGGVAGDPFGQFDAGHGLATLEEPLDALVHEPEPGPQGQDRGLG